MAKDTVGQDLLVGRTLGHYRIVAPLDKGGQGFVYRACDLHLDNRQVAIKILPPDSLTDPAARQRFRKEANTLSKLNHPNIALVIDFDCCDGIDFLAEEFVEGTSLDRAVAAGAWPEKRVVRFGLELFEGLAAAHERGVIHRDIKPANLRVSTNGHLKILDFGLAKWMSSGPAGERGVLTESETQTIAGTLPYMSPEQLQNERLDGRADIWAAGCVLYEMATKQRPFDGSDVITLADAILHRKPITPLKLNPQISEGLEAVILKCLEKDAELRYQSAREVIVDLNRLSAGTVIAHRVPPSPPNPRSRKIALLVAAGVLASLGAWWTIVHFLPPRSIAVLPFEDMSPDQSLKYLGEGLAEDTRNYLAKIPNLKVAAKLSSIQLGTEVDLRAVGQKLGVASVLEGSIRKEGARLRITVKLIKVADGFHIWSESYDRELTDAFSIQDEIARSVAAALKLTLFGGKLPGSGPLPANPEAYDAFLQARHLANRNDPTSAREAFDFASKAIDLDPNYAPSYALRAGILLNELGGMGRMDPAKAAEQARADTLDAIAKDPNLAAGHLMHSALQSQIELNCPAAEVSLNKARELAPSDPDIMEHAARLAMCQGRLEEAASLYKEELDRDPLRPDDHQYRAQILRDLGRYDEARAELAEALRLNSQEAMVHEVLGEIYLSENNPQQALAEMEKEAPGCIRDMGITIAYHGLGQPGKSDAALKEMLARCSDDWTYQIAQVYGYRGETDRAFEWLDLAYQRHDPGLMWFKTDLKLKSLRGDPRYRTMLAKLHMPE